MVEPESPLQDAAELIPALQFMAKACGLSENFLINLFRETDDWSFVIKAHALLESVVCSLIATHLRRPELEHVFANDVEMSARIKVLKALDLVSEDDRRMMRALGTLRNDLVHNAEATEFRFTEYFRNKQLRDNFVATFGLNWPDPVPGPTVGESRSRKTYVLENPRYAIWASVLGIVKHTVDELHQRLLDKAVRGLMDAAPGRSEPSSSPSR